MNIDIQRVTSQDKHNTALLGHVHYVPSKSIWISAMYALAIIGGALTFSWEALAVFLVTSAITLCLGHSLGMHRRLIHNSYACPLWLEYIFVYLGVLVGLAGPIGMMRTHDLRDWAQRQTQCHDYFAHRQSMLRDWYWQLHCDVKLDHPPTFKAEPQIANDKFYRFIENYWMWQQLPLVLLLGLMGGVSWIIWGVCVRVMVSVTGHWLVGYFAHNEGDKLWHVEGAAVQGYNIKNLGLITMGECWHNNHHAFPGSAKLGLNDNEVDPGWWVLKTLEKLGLVWDIKLPEDLAERPELKPENDQASAKVHTQHSTLITNSVNNHHG